MAALQGIDRTDDSTPLASDDRSVESSSPSSRSPSPPRSTATTVITTHSSRGPVTTTSTTEVTHAGTSTVQHQLRNDGSLSIRPVARRSKSGRSAAKVSVRKVVTYKDRVSTFDRFNPDSQQDVFRGFYTLFWIFLAIIVGRTLQYNYNGSDDWLRFDFAKMFSEDAKVLAATDLVLIATSFLCVPFVKLIQYDWIKYQYTGIVIQHTAQALWLFMWIRWTFMRSWPWVQSGFLTLHAISMMMKIHSYCAVNGDLSIKHKSAQKGLEELEKLVKSQHESWDQVVKEAEEHQHLEEPETPKATTFTAGVSTAIENGNSSDSRGVHRRKGDVAKTEAIATSTLDLTTTPTSSSKTPSEATQKASMLILISNHHPDIQLSTLAKEVGDALEELTSTVDGHITWPENVSVSNFWDYLLVPCLVYEIAYPRTKVIRPLYILEKTIATFGTFTLLVITTQYYVWDVYPEKGESFVEAFTKLILPFTLNYLLIFYIIFECICNAFAEISMFADREFYSDWWNSTSFDEFARKWNKPVHNFLLRHVYASSISTWGLSRSQAALVTFSLSALMHELLMAVVTKKLRLYLFMLQMGQLPLIALGQLKWFKQYPALGNFFFWIGLLSGFPLLGVCYILY